MVAVDQRSGSTRTHDVGDLSTLLWLHGLLLTCAGRAPHQAEWRHYTDKAARVAAQISEHVVREDN